MRTSLRIGAWIAFVIVAIARPGVEAIDRLLASRCWNVPSEWNAVADVAMRTGAVDPNIGGSPAPWRQASVLPLGSSRIAVVTVSDMVTSRVSFMTDQYRVVGVLTRKTTEPSLVTDEVRGYKSLSHIWPILEEDGRLLTLIAMAPLRSDPVRLGVFAYVAVGATSNELLFVCRLDSAPGPTWGEMVRLDANGDGADDLVVFERGQRTNPPIATFTWNRETRTYDPRVTAAGRPLVAWWARTADDRVIFDSAMPADEAIQRVVPRLTR
jgi:hypothetical protein